ncbi:hypothetical protein AB0B89_12630 [Sphaerisporangium sp. NPDC049002]
MEKSNTAAEDGRTARFVALGNHIRLVGELPALVLAALALASSSRPWG